jgi:hypothetical protein
VCGGKAASWVVFEHVTGLGKPWCTKNGILIDLKAIANDAILFVIGQSPATYFGNLIVALFW